MTKDLREVLSGLAIMFENWNNGVYANEEMFLYGLTKLMIRCRVELKRNKRKIIEVSANA